MVSWVLIEGNTTWFWEFQLFNHETHRAEIGNLMADEFGGYLSTLSWLGIIIIHDGNPEKNQLNQLKIEDVQKIWKGKEHMTWGLGTSQFRWIVIIQMKQFLDLYPDLTVQVNCDHPDETILGPFFFWSLSLSRSIPFTASSERIDAAPHVMTLRSSHYRSRQGLNALNALNAERFGKSWFPLTWHYFQMSWCGNDLLSRVCPRSLVTSNGPMGACNQRFSRSLVVFGIFHGDISWGYGDGSKPIVTIWLGEKKGT